MYTHHNPIIEISPYTAIHDITYRVTGLTNCIGLLVIGGDNDIDCRLLLQMIPLPCAGIAFVTEKRLRRRRRLTASLSLSRHYACPCQIFEFAESGRQWLEKRLSESYF